MNLNAKLAALEKIYAIYDSFIDSLELACKKKCAYCCTTRVTLTTLEGYKIVQALESETSTVWHQNVQEVAAQNHFIPKMTTNEFARLCAEGNEPPAEEIGESKACPFLTEAQCPIYAVRPFGCRCLVSRHDCGRSGYADIEDMVLSVNTVMLQTIEHLDADGCSGNMLDVLTVLAGQVNQQAYEEGKLVCGSTGLIGNQPLEVLMIPPEHRTRMEPILKSLREIRL
jgi:Fe-S-cluster containining protein